MPALGVGASNRRHPPPIPTSPRSCRRAGLTPISSASENLRASGEREKHLVGLMAKGRTVVLGSRKYRTAPADTPGRSWLPRVRRRSFRKQGLAQLDGNRIDYLR